MKHLALLVLFVAVAAYALSWALIGRSSILPAAGGGIGLSGVERFGRIHLFSAESYGDEGSGFGDFNATAQSEFVKALRSIADSVIVHPGTYETSRADVPEHVGPDDALLMVYISRNAPFTATVEVAFLIGDGSASYSHRYIWLFGWHELSSRQTSIS